MSSKTSVQIIHDIETHIATSNSSYDEWYVGITDSPKHTLFSVHKLRTTGDGWISRRAQDDLKALTVAEYFQTVLKTKGKRSNTSLEHVFVYAYKIKAHTKQ